MKNLHLCVIALLVVSIVLVACGTSQAAVANQTTATGTPAIRVLATVSFLADLAQNVAGERLKIDSLIPAGLDPHAFEPTPQDVARIAESQILIINGGGLEYWLQETLTNAGGKRTVIEASASLKRRVPQEGEIGAGAAPAHETDPHFWLDPVNAIQYVENIRDGLAQADPAGKEIYTQNAAAYITQLKDLDAWVRKEVEQIPPERRLLVTNHESFGYFADRYGFKIVGAIIPSVNTTASPSAQQLAYLIDRIRSTGAPAIFLETGSNPDLAAQIAQETGVKVVTDLYTHSLSDATGPAPNYIALIKHNVISIVEALK
jgi:ABC-type Zn uptake system ZnuABC Zn-binding protein ZnuA